MMRATPEHGHAITLDVTRMSPASKGLVASYLGLWKVAEDAGETAFFLDLVQYDLRGQSVLDELRGRRVLTSAFVAKGYGETLPIADNDTAEGRETNRRIEFKLIRPEPIVEVPTGLEQTEEQSIVETGTTEAGTEE